MGSKFIKQKHYAKKITTEFWNTQKMVFLKKKKKKNLKLTKHMRERERERERDNQFEILNLRIGHETIR